MPFVANTPESLLGRSDSKDPGLTCRGIMSSGRPCRRPVPRVPDAERFCWQHKEQESRPARSSPGVCLIAERSSLDTLADRLGLLDLGQAPAKPGAGGAGKQRPARPEQMKKKKKEKKEKKLRFCFCFTIDEVPEPACPRLVPAKHAASVPDTKRNRQRTSASPSKSRRTARDLIPDSLDAATASALMAELARPYADAEEVGYIYMFWLTPAPRQAQADAARTLLTPPSPARPRRPSDSASRFSDGIMLLKIGRAANVQRRMNEWQRQCGHDLEVLRFYPYVPGDAAPRTTPRTTPHCRRVERLIHLELTGMGFRARMETCAACGRDHREWFEVEATRDGIRSVDGVICKWVE